MDRGGTPRSYRRMVCSAGRGCSAVVHESPASVSCMSPIMPGISVFFTIAPSMSLHSLAESILSSIFEYTGTRVASLHPVKQSLAPKIKLPGISNQLSLRIQ